MQAPAFAGFDGPPPPQTMRFPASTLADFARVEAALAACLRAPPDRCGFLRSAAYLRFRMRALYRPGDDPFELHAPAGLRLDYGRDPDGAGQVAIVVAGGEAPAPQDQAHALSADCSHMTDQELSRFLYQSYRLCAALRQ